MLVLGRSRCVLALASRRVRLPTLLLGPRALGTSPEYEHENDGAQETYLRKPGPGGFARRNFVQERLGQAVDAKYKLVGSLGKAGMSKVYVAQHRESGRKVCVKAAERHEAQRFDALSRELEFLKATDHPNVLRLFEAFEDPDKLCLVLEFCCGGDLDDMVREKHRGGGVFTDAELRDLTREMLRAVAYCHAQSIVHRDIKPSNFMFSPRLKLVDFGVSGVVPCGNPSARRLKVRTGTDGYIAPEIISERPYGPSADMFSLGCTLFNMITGKVPRWIDSMGFYSFPDSGNLGSISDECADLLSRLLPRNPQLRPSASEALEHEWLARDRVGETPKTSGADRTTLQRFHKRGKLQRCARASMLTGSSLSDPVLQELESEFLENTNNDGEIRKKELKGMLHLGSIEAASLLDGMNNSQQGALALSEWLVAVTPAEVFSCRDAARRAFEPLDRDGDGLISAGDLHEVLPQVFSKEELLGEMKRWDKNGDGCLDFDEFCELLKEEL